jgi:signal transduction histidine kinase
MKRALITIFLVLIQFLAHNQQLLYADDSEPQTWKSPRIVEGSLDLRGWRYIDSETIFLDGEWAFYWEGFLYPTETPPVKLYKTGYFTVPGTWNGYKIKEKELSGEGYASYRLEVAVDKEPAWYGIKLLDLGTAYQLWVDGEMLASNGKISKSSSGFEPEYRPQTTFFKSKGSTIEIVIQISNYIHSKGGPWERIEFGSREQITKSRDTKFAFDMIIFGALFIMGLYHFGIYFQRKQQTFPLFFGGICIVTAVRVLFTGEFYFASFFPQTNWEFIVKIGYITFYLVPPGFALFLSSFYPKEFNKVIQNLSVFLGACFTLIALLTPVGIYSRINVLYEIFVLLLFVYMFYVLIRSVINKREGGLIFIAGFLVLFSTVINDLLSRHEVIDSVYLGPFGLFIFIFSQSIILSRYFSHAFQQAEKLARELKRADHLKSEFLTNMSHELRTPMHHIGSYAQIGIKRIHTNKEKVLECFENVVSATNRMMVLVNDLFDLSKMETGKMAYSFQKNDVLLIIDDNIARFSQQLDEKELSINMDQSVGSTELVCDRIKINQVVQNLLSNAIKFSPKNKSILILIESKNSSLSVSIRDEGPGIPDDELDFIFDRFVQSSKTKTGAGGTGLGLAICKEIIEQHHGKIWAVNNPEGGATIKFLLPYSN